MGIKSRIRSYIKFLRGRLHYYKNNTNPLVPPPDKIFIGAGDFLKVGEGFFKHFKEIGGLKPGDQILEIGCGLGRMAIPLTNYLNKTGSYTGMDIVKSGIKWCKRKYRFYPNFYFYHMDIYNKYYNPKGEKRAKDYNFPFADEHFTFIFLTSVFTHMLKDDVEHYVKEIARMLKKGETAFITFFLINEESSSLIAQRESRVKFVPYGGPVYVSDPEVPEAITGYDESYIIKLLNDSGLKLKAPVYYGSWCGRKNYLSYQDIVVLEKSQATRS